MSTAAACYYEDHDSGEASDRKRVREKPSEEEPVDDSLPIAGRVLMAMKNIDSLVRRDEEDPRLRRGRGSCHRNDDIDCYDVDYRHYDDREDHGEVSAARKRAREEPPEEEPVDFLLPVGVRSSMSTNNNNNMFSKKEWRMWNEIQTDLLFGNNIHLKGMTENPSEWSPEKTAFYEKHRSSIEDLVRIEREDEIRREADFAYDSDDANYDDHYASSCDTDDYGSDDDDYDDKHDNEPPTNKQVHIIPLDE